MLNLVRFAQETYFGKGNNAHIASDGLTYALRHCEKCDTAKLNELNNYSSFTTVIEKCCALVGAF